MSSNCTYTKANKGTIRTIRSNIKNADESSKT